MDEVTRAEFRRQALSMAMDFARHHVGKVTAEDVVGVAGIFAEFVLGESVYDDDLALDDAAHADVGD